MLRTYLIDGQEVTVDWTHRQHPAEYRIRVAGVPTAGCVKKTFLGKFVAVDAQGCPLGTFLGLREAVERLVREERR